MPGGGEGCTPGYWKQPHHFFAWTAPYTPDTLFCDVFFGDFPGDECAFPGLTLLEFERRGKDSRCCGAGGAARKVYHDNAVAIGRLSIDEAVEKKAQRLILSCPACYGKVHEAMEGYDKQVRITDIMELAAECL